MHTWQLQEAKAKPSQLIHAPQSEPQFISRHGVEISVVLNIEKYKELTEDQNDLVAFLRNSPLKGLIEKMNLRRERSGLRDTEL